MIFLLIGFGVVNLFAIALARAAGKTTPERGEPLPLDEAVSAASFPVAAYDSHP